MIVRCALALAAAGCIAARPPCGAERRAAASGFRRLVARDLDADRWFDELGGDAAPARQVVLIVERGDVVVRQLTVHFADGRSFAPYIRTSFASDSASRVIDLPAGPRRIRDVELDYGRHDAAARVELWAR